MLDTLVIVDCEAPLGVGSPAVGDITEFGAVHFESLKSFHGRNCSKEVFQDFGKWLRIVVPKGRPIFTSDNPAYDFQWINFYFWRYTGGNPFGHSARRIGDFYAGLTGDFTNTQAWKKLRVTPHTHHPVDDAMGNAEALARILKGER